MPTELELLAALRKFDQELMQLRQRMDDLRAQRNQLTAALEKARLALEAERGALEAMRHRSRDLNLEVDGLDEQIRQDDKRLREGLLSYKEMEALRARMEHSRPRLGKLAEEAIALLDTVEQQAAAFKRSEAEFARRRTKLEEEITSYTQAIERTNERIRSRDAERNQLMRQAPSDLMAVYEGLRQKYSDPIASIKGRSCSGCQLSVSEIAIERAREALELLFCENCGRILI